MAEEIKQETAEPTPKTYTEAEYNALQQQLDAMQKSLDTANTTIQSYKDMDIESIQASVEDYKQKWEQSEKDRKAKESEECFATSDALCDQFSFAVSFFISFIVFPSIRVL